MESILTSIKKLLGITDSYEFFDDDIVLHINTALSTLTQLGVGPSEGFMIQDDTSVWDDFIPENIPMNLVKTYVYIKVRLVFDPPQSSAVMNALDTQLKELEWRINSLAELSNQ